MSLAQTAKQELAQFIEVHGRPVRVEVLICDCNGIFRGKWFPGDDLEKLILSGTNFPKSLLFGDLTCDTPSNFLQYDFQGDPDSEYQFVLGSLKPVIWRGQATAQIQMSLTSETGYDPRNLLEQWLIENDFCGFVALESEFVIEGHHTVLMGEQVYSHQALEEAELFINKAYEIASTQGIALTSVLPEYGRGQFEINLRHRSDPLYSADELMASKRIIKAAAGSIGKFASFMALPTETSAGNGCHVHVSLLDEQGENLFSDETQLASACNGILTTVSECTALLAPHANSYRRLSLAGEFNAPMATWGENHRGTMLRLPKASIKDRRIEFRFAGADVNPYLLTLYMLGAMRHGLSMGIAPQMTKVEQGGALDVGAPLITRWNTAIDKLDESSFARNLFGDRFITTYVRMKRCEEAKFHGIVGKDTDRAWASNVV